MGRPEIDGLVATFEHCVDALEHDADYRDIEIVERRAHRSGRVHELTVSVDRPGGVDIDTCGRIAARLNAELESFTEDFQLIVASAGLERPLLRPSDYERFRERDAVIKTSLPINHEYTHEGTLAGLRGTTIILKQKKGELPIPYEMVKSAHLAYDFRADLQRAKKEKRERGN